MQTDTRESYQHAGRGHGRHGRAAASLTRELHAKGGKPTVRERVAFDTVEHDAMAILEREGTKGLEERLHRGQVLSDATPAARLTFAFAATEDENSYTGGYGLAIGIRQPYHYGPRYVCLDLDDGPLDTDMVWNLVKDFYTPAEVN